MNPLIREAVASIQGGWLLGVMTLVFFACFAGWIVWAWAPQNRERLDEEARLPFMDGGEQ